MQFSMAIEQECFADTEQVYEQLLEQCKKLPNTEYLAKMVASLYSDKGAMPAYLGLSKDNFDYLISKHFPKAILPTIVYRDPLDTTRSFEREDLMQLFLDHSVRRDFETQLIAEILIVGCMGGDHLWQDLGLWSRNDVSALIKQNFPALFAKNEKNMKWKKFLYKQLCIGEGVYICRAPSCEVCSDYKNCFGTEE